MIIIWLILIHVWIGIMIFWIENKLVDSRYHKSLFNKFKGMAYLSETKPWWSTNNWALDEYLKKTQKMPINQEDIKWNSSFMKKAKIGAISNLILWPIIAIVNPIHKKIIYKQICRKAETAV